MAAYATKQNNQKVSGPIAKALMNLVMPIAMTFRTPERMFGWMHGYRIQWDAVVTAAGTDRARLPAMSDR